MAASPTFGDLLRQHRLAAGPTQESLAERAGLNEKGIQELERGVTRPYRDNCRPASRGTGVLFCRNALRQADGAPLHPAQRRVVERWLTRAREALGEAATAVAWTAGRSLPIELALEEAERSAGARMIRLTS